MKLEDIVVGRTYATIHGQLIRVLCKDRKCDNGFVVVGLEPHGNIETIRYCHPEDLSPTKVKKEAWIVLWKPRAASLWAPVNNGTYSTAKEAYDRLALHMGDGNGNDYYQYQYTISHVEWEEEG